MTRQKESKKDRRKYVDKTIADTDVSPFVSGTPEKSNSTRLKPIKKTKGNRLPPLNNNRLPELKHTSSQNSANGTATPLLYLARSDKTTLKPGIESAAVKTNTPEELNRTLKEPLLTKSGVVINRGSNSNVQSISFQKKKDNESQPIPSTSTTVHANDKPTEKLHRGKNIPKLLTEPNIVISNSKLTKLIKQESIVDCRKERDLLRQHRKQQAEKMKATRQPLKATQVYDTYGKEVKKKTNDSGNLKGSSNREMKTVNLSVRRKCNDDDDWDWDKDIEEYMELEQNAKTEKQSTYGQHPVQNGGQRLSPVLPPASTISSKKGVGFKSKKRLEEERLQALARQEEERQQQQKEKDRIEMMIPQKVKKDLKKYGFR